MAINQNTLRPAMLGEVRLLTLRVASFSPAIEYICGFSGSAGTAVITMNKAALATDGRYFNQASKQLDDNWTLLRQGLEDVPTWQEWYSQDLYFLQLSAEAELDQDYGTS
jgi:Creatinase/Prolidase N-terminal domain